MQGRVAFFVTLFLVLVSVRGYWRHGHEAILGKEKVTHLHFYLHDILSGDNATTVEITRPNHTAPNNLPTFGTLLVVNEPMTAGPEPNSEVIGNSQGLVVLAGRQELSSVLTVDFGFTSGKFNGSSISIFSRRPVDESLWELAVVGGREKFRFARGFADFRTQFKNLTTGDAVYEFNVTVLHYEMI